MTISAPTPHSALTELLAALRACNEDEKARVDDVLWVWTTDPHAVWWTDTCQRLHAALVAAQKEAERWEEAA